MPTADASLLADITDLVDASAPVTDVRIERL